MSTTAIEWTESTWNPVTGCSKVSPGCAHCYAETVARRFWPTQYPLVALPTNHASDLPHYRPRAFTDVMCHEDRLDQPLRRKKPTTYFVNSMSDLFHEAVPDDYIAEVWKVMSRTPRHTYQVLTKRAERMRAILPRLVATFGVLPNVWLGTSVENQHFADERIPLLLQTPAAVRFISAEPLLEAVNLKRIVLGTKRTNGYGDRWIEWDALTGWESQWTDREHAEKPGGLPRSAGSGPDRRLDWVIVGGESGPQARPCDLAWVRSIVTQCQAAGVPVFVKQLGAKSIEVAYPRNPTDAERQQWQRDGWCRVTSSAGESWTKHPRIQDRKGGDPSEWPADLRVREMPGCAHTWELPA